MIKGSKNPAAGEREVVLRRRIKTYENGLDRLLEKQAKDIQDRKKKIDELKQAYAEYLLTPEGQQDLITNEEHARASHEKRLASIQKFIDKRNSDKKIQDKIK